MSEAILYLNNSSSFENNISFYDFPIEEHKKKLFDDKGFTIIKNFISKDDEEIYLDEKLDYGDLVFLDQASYYHEVKKIKVTDKQIGRLQFYVPTIPYGYMKDCYKFQDYPFKYYFSKKLNFLKKIYLIFTHYLKEKQIHYSMMNFFKYYK